MQKKKINLQEEDQRNAYNQGAADCFHNLQPQWESDTEGTLLQRAYATGYDDMFLGECTTLIHERLVEEALRSGRKPTVD